MGNTAGDTWMREFEDAMRLADEIMSKIQEASDLARAGKDASRSVSSTRRSITRLNAKADRLDALLKEGPEKAGVSERELYRRQDMVVGIRYRAKSQAATLTQIGNSADRGALLPSSSQPAETDRTAGLENQGIVGLQKQIMKEQDDQLDELAQTVSSTHHIALAVNDELDLHTQLLDDIDRDLDSTRSRVKNVRDKLTRLSRQSSRSCSYICLFLTMIGIIIVLLVLMDVLKWV
eukprot:TRINITY_DN9787_c0_g1_i1.p1 TRINITY_DN9787_c0_g1~~TRINITY_DN9787_c0_g1_i1.p1  ORF type:complete len:235 (-),score=67.04 TRINITY_DN9787_c0_g1_i1:278-982(-)